MSQIFKIALPGYNALSDTNPDHFSLYVDNQVDYVLIKEKEEAIVSVNGTTEISHGLNYIPFCLVFYESSPGTWRKVHGAPDPTDSAPHFEVDDSKLYLINPTGSAINFSYYIFYDNIT